MARTTTPANKARNQRASGTARSTELPSSFLRTPTLSGELAAEFFGTFILILFGTGVVAQVVAGGIGDHDSIAWAWGLGVTLGIYTAGRISGAHLNPAVSIALAAFQGFPWRKVAPYVVAQTLGAFVAALIVRWNYTEVIAAVDPGHTKKTQGIFNTLPGNGTLPVGTGGALRDQIIGTAILVFLVFAITDARIKVGGKIRCNSTLTFSHIPFPNPDLRGHTCVRGSLFFFSQTRVQPGEVIGGTNPHDACEHMYPTKQQVEPFTEGGINMKQGFSLTDSVSEL